ncbi:transcriptional regulator [Vibrio cincinnatiensis]|jgi:glycine cleavage system regulatory protein|uniref:Glycine cleavage system transcriptional repressor n=1 Tax=Vibrio cincinnatiensis DSM 19608 TaxID=1123491 RepID=A0A1T4M0T7_VIBCI|nr:ACT domain-containing protein [Vibrio cincinnatiensis]MCG3723568.1 transcriptional regulator [Vibrio cincinnatiensis]MCG3726629.1 transcriptional regulator [Vibrio cincinnatiensis]MCG3733267.1 transcriptional regulator [Vibrio cincinnatiensis]MCG3735431.1 transcriptional regulator [Vibrio cincinnatiensis]MCG3740169.1 transcriptional regulator [Vibrio cincinnatiensis]
MNCTFIVNFVGTATAATIKQLAAITHENDGKWLISKVNFIDNQVAAVIKVEMPLDKASIVKEAFQSHPDLLVKIVDCEANINKEESIYQVRLDANDRFGIVNEITHLLDGQGIGILDMDCQRVFLAGGGVSSNLFTATMAIRLPAEINIEDVAKELEALSEDTRVVIES